MPWWGWIVLGALLLGAELFVIPTDFFLVFLGASAIAVGGVAWLGVGLSPAVQWLLFAALAVVAFVLFRRRWAARAAHPANPRVEGLVGEIGTAHEPIAAGGTGRVELRGAPWSAQNVGDAIEPGARVRVERVEGLTLCVRRI
jgi:membrane protein implicated in regulation of membrane protease activity